MKKNILTIKNTIEMFEKLESMLRNPDIAQGGSPVVSCDPLREYSCIVGIETGGIPLAEYLANNFWLDLKKITIQLRREDTTISDIIAISPNLIRFRVPSTPFLLVDDVVDTGSTIQAFESITGYKYGVDFDTASLHWCENQSPNYKPTYYVNLKSEDEWVIYPWEKESDFYESWGLVQF